MVLLRFNTAVVLGLSVTSTTNFSMIFTIVCHCFIKSSSCQSKWNITRTKLFFFFWNIDFRECTQAYDKCNNFDQMTQEGHPNYSFYAYPLKKRNEINREENHNHQTKTKTKHTTWRPRPFLHQKRKERQIKNIINHFWACDSDISQYCCLYKSSTLQKKVNATAGVHVISPCSS